MNNIQSNGKVTYLDLSAETSKNALSKLSSGDQEILNGLLDSTPEDSKQEIFDIYTKYCHGLTQNSIDLLWKASSTEWMPLFKLFGSMGLSPQYPTDIENLFATIFCKNYDTQSVEIAKHCVEEAGEMQSIRENIELFEKLKPELRKALFMSLESLPLHNMNVATRKQTLLTLRDIFRLFTDKDQLELSGTLPKYLVNLTKDEVNQFKETIAQGAFGSERKAKFYELYNAFQKI